MATEELIDIKPLTVDLPIYQAHEGGYAILDETRCQYVWYWDIPNWVDDAQIGEPLPEGWTVAPFNDLAREEMPRPLLKEVLEARRL